MSSLKIIENHDSNVADKFSRFTPRFTLVLNSSNTPLYLVLGKATHDSHFRRVLTEVNKLSAGKRLLQKLKLFNPPNLHKLTYVNGYFSGHLVTVRHLIRNDQEVTSTAQLRQIAPLVMHAFKTHAKQTAHP